MAAGSRAWIWGGVVLGIVASHAGLLLYRLSDWGTTNVTFVAYYASRWHQIFDFVVKYVSR
jgi:hypothetical protein